MFAGMIDALFEGPLGLDAFYTPPASGAETVAVRVIRRTESSEVALGMAGAAGSAHGYDVRVSQVAEPAEGATLLVGAASFVVRSRLPDEMDLVWKLDLDPTPG